MYDADYLRGRVYTMRWGSAPRALAALLDDPDSVLSTHRVAHNPNSSSRRSYALGLLQPLHTDSAYEYMQAKIHIMKYKSIVC